MASGTADTEPQAEGESEPGLRRPGLDRNAVNWLRGGAFNPSGVVRIPSLFGDGTGVVAALVNRNARVVVSLPGRGAGAGLVDCG